MRLPGRRIAADGDQGLGLVGGASERDSLAVVALLCCRRQQSWRPAFIAAGSVFTLNLLVLILKVGLGRGQPGLADPSFFVGGMAYPSGHTANIVLVYGLAVYLLGRYLRVSRRTYAIGWVLVVGLSLLMVAVSMSLNWHWFADLVAGLLVGGVVLELSVAADLGYRPVRGPLASDTVTTLVGFTEISGAGRLHNAAAVFHGGAVVGPRRWSVSAPGGAMCVLIRPWQEPAWPVSATAPGGRHPGARVPRRVRRSGMHARRTRAATYVTSPGTSSQP